MQSGNAVADDGPLALEELLLMTTAEAFLARSPTLGESYLVELVAMLDARIERMTAALRADGAADEVIAEVRAFYLGRPFHAARPTAGLAEWHWRRDWAALVSRIGTPRMRAGLTAARTCEEKQIEEVRAKLNLAGITPSNARSISSSPAQPERLIRDVTSAGRLLELKDAASYARVRLGDGDKLAARLEREAFQADRIADESGHPLPDDGLSDDERATVRAERYWTPTRVLNRVMRPATRALARVRRAERALTDAGSRHLARRAAEELARVRAEWDVAPVLTADLDAERETLRPIVKAAIDGTSRRWRHCQGRVFDEKGVDLMPPCLRTWQVL